MTDTTKITLDLDEKQDIRLIFEEGHVLSQNDIALLTLYIRNFFKRLDAEYK